MWFDPPRMRKFIVTVWIATLFLVIGVSGTLVWAIIKLVNHYAP